MGTQKNYSCDFSVKLGVIISRHEQRLPWRESIVMAFYVYRMWTKNFCAKSKVKLKNLILMLG